MTMWDLFLSGRFPRRTKVLLAMTMQSILRLRLRMIMRKILNANTTAQDKKLKNSAKMIDFSSTLTIIQPIL